MMITIVIGPPCAGKSTFVRDHAQPGDVVVDFDALAVALGASKSHDAEDAPRAAAFVARQAVIDHLIEHPDVDAFVIHTRPKADDVDAYASAGDDVRWLLVDPGKETCLERAKADGRPDRTAGVIEDWYRDPPALPHNDEDDPTRKAGVMNHKTRTVDLLIKAAGPADGLLEGQFLAYASVFDNVDSDGDITRKGAFADTLADWAALNAKSGAVIPVLYGHDMWDPNNSVGFVVEATEDDHGLKVLGQFDLEGGNGPQVYRMVKGRRLSQLSFAYDVIDSKDSTIDGVGVRELLKLKLYEVSLVPVGANQSTEVLAVKAARIAADLVEGAKAGRVLSSKNEATLREARASLMGSVVAIDSVLELVDSDDSGTDSGKASAAEPDRLDDEPEGAKSGADPTPQPVDRSATLTRLRFATANQEGV